MADTNVPINPECAQGKHENCDTRALNESTDEIVTCGCGCHETGHDE